jgi:hypothetical protein
MKFFVERNLQKTGWEKRYQNEMARLRKRNEFDDLKEFG